MTTSDLGLSAEIEACRSRLEADLLDVPAAICLRESVATEITRLRADSVARSPVPPFTRSAVLAALAEATGVLNGGAAWRGGDAAPAPPVFSAEAYEALVIHPREKQERQHQLSSLAGRALHLLQGNETARAIARVTERAAPERHPELCRRLAGCAAALSVTLPAVHLARGEEPLFTLLLDRQPFLCIHAPFIEAGPGRLSPAELTFAAGRCLQPIRGRHAALSQIGPDRLENLLLDELPLLVRTPIRMASRAVGWTRANEAVKSLGERLPGTSTARRVVSTVGNLLPTRDQETVLPEVVHDWVRRFIEGVEWSADRAGLLLCGSPGAACGGLLALCPTLVPRLSELREQGARRLLQNPDTIGRAAADRLREILRFALSREYLEFVAAPAGTP